MKFKVVSILFFVEWTIMILTWRKFKRNKKVTDVLKDKSNHVQNLNTSNSCQQRQHIQESKGSERSSPSFAMLIPYSSSMLMIPFSPNLARIT
jgi:hypothetical protein